MKKFKVLLATFVLAGLTLTSCSSDDNSGPSTPATINAKWTPIKTITKVGSQPEVSEDYLNNEAGCDKDYIEFSGTSTFKDQYFYKNGSNVCTEDEAGSGSWSKNDNNLTITSDDSAYEGVYKIETLTNSDLVIYMEETIGQNTVVLKYVFKKV